MMKAPAVKTARISEPPDFAVTVRKRVAKSDALVSAKSPPKRDNIFSKSRDTREDRGQRQMKNSSNPQTFSHGH